MTFRKLLIQETEYIQGLGRDAAVKTYPIQRVLTPRIDMFFILLAKFGSAITEHMLILRLKVRNPLSESSLERVP